jgi:hypothetical protein
MGPEGIDPTPDSDIDIEPSAECRLQMLFA